MIYIGDGAGDYCPMLKLKENDYAMPRKNFPVWELICKNPNLVKATVREWTDGQEFADILLRLIGGNTNKFIELNHAEFDNNHDHKHPMLQHDCKFQTTAVPAAIYDALPQALPVPY